MHNRNQQVYPYLYDMYSNNHANQQMGRFLQLVDQYANDPNRVSPYAAFAGRHSPYATTSSSSTISATTNRTNYTQAMLPRHQDSPVIPAREVSPVVYWSDSKFSLLPGELLLKIAEHFSPQQLAVFSRVSKQFYFISSDNQLWAAKFAIHFKSKKKQIDQSLLEQKNAKEATLQKEQDKARKANPELEYTSVFSPNDQDWKSAFQTQYRAQYEEGSYSPNLPQSTYKNRSIKYSEIYTALKELDFHLLNQVDFGTNPWNTNPHRNTKIFSWFNNDSKSDGNYFDVVKKVNHPLLFKYVYNTDRSENKLFIAILCQQPLAEIISQISVAAPRHNLRYLLTKLADPYYGHSLLTLAAFNNRLDIIKYLFETYPTLVSDMIDTVDKFGQSALLWAAAHNNEEMLNYLLSKKANLNAFTNSGDRVGYTAIYWAVTKGYINIVKILLKAGASLAFNPDSDIGLLHLAIDTENVEMVRLLVKNTNLLTQHNAAQQSPLAYAIDHGNVEIFKIIYFADIDHQLRQGLRGIVSHPTKKVVIKGFDNITSRHHDYTVTVPSEEKRFTAKDQVMETIDTVLKSRHTHQDKIQLILAMISRIPISLRALDKVLHPNRLFEILDGMNPDESAATIETLAADFDLENILQGASNGFTPEENSLQQLTTIFYSMIIRVVMNHLIVNEDINTIRLYLEKIPELKELVSFTMVNNSLVARTKASVEDLIDLILEIQPKIFDNGSAEFKQVIDYLFNKDLPEFIPFLDSLVIRNPEVLQYKDENNMNFYVRAFKAGHYDIAAYLLSFQDLFDPAVDENGDHLLVSAVQSNNLFAINFLLSKKVNPDIIVTVNNPQPLIHFAAELGNCAVLEAILHLYPQLAISKDSAGFTPALRAATHGQEKATKLLLWNQDLSTHYATGGLDAFHSSKNELLNELVNYICKRTANDLPYNEHKFFDRIMTKKIRENHGVKRDVKLKAATALWLAAQNPGPLDLDLLHPHMIAFTSGKELPPIFNKLKSLCNKDKGLTSSSTSSSAPTPRKRK